MKTNIITRTLYRRLTGRNPFKATVHRHWPMMETEINDFSFHLYPGDNYSDRLAFLGQDYCEPRSVRKMLEVTSGIPTLFLDIGANSGQFTIPVTHYAADGSRTIAFEPNPIMAERLIKNISLNGLEDSIEVRGNAISDSRAPLKLNLHNYNYGSSSLMEVAESDRAVEVPCQPLSDFMVLEDGIEQIVIKIDVEGFEPRVLGPFLRDAPEDLLPRHVLLEVVLADRWDADLRALFVSRGYHSTFCDEDNELFSRPG